MLFNSAQFILIFLPIALLGFQICGRYSRELALGWLTTASFIFYGWWNPIYIPLLLGSIIVNYLFGRGIESAASDTIKKWFVGLGVTINLGVLAWFKYANFFNQVLVDNDVVTTQLPPIILPLAISFFTFTQIAYLVDVYRNKTHPSTFLHYAFFVSFFPHLIAGPIVHHYQIIPQIPSMRMRLEPKDLTIGVTLFLFGLIKKVLIADSFSPIANERFGLAESGEMLTFIKAWDGTLAFGLQIYFDFSAYSDMALGLAIMFGMRFPLNFNSPYKATSVIGFWRRWHITLSKFLRDYLYIPLGGSRCSTPRRFFNLAATMLLGGLWHGAGWTFIFWGGLHGIYLMINHLWRSFTQAYLPRARHNALTLFIAWLLTFTCVHIAWALFRAPELSVGLNVVWGLLGANGFEFAGRSLPALAFGIIVVCFAPNTQQMLARFKPCLDKVELPHPCFQWKATPLRAVVLGFLLFVIIKKLLEAQPAEFLYFEF